MSGTAPPMPPPPAMNPSPPGAPPPAWTPPPPGAPSYPGTPVPPRKSSTLAIVLVAVVVVIVLVIAGLYAAGVGPFSKSSNSSSEVSSAQTFDEAAATANQSANAYGGGPYSIWIGGGLDLMNAVSATTSLITGVTQNLSTIPDCTATLLVSSGTTLVLPGFDGNLSTGQAPVWFFIMLSGSDSLLILDVVGGTAQILEKVSGSGCSADLSYFGSVPVTKTDSPAAVAAALNAGGYAFMKQHPGGNLSFSVSGGISVDGFSSPGSWSVDYSTCPSTTATTSGSHYEFSAQVSFAGVVQGTPSAGAVASCQGLGNLSGGSPGGGGGGGSSGTQLSTAFSLGNTMTSPEVDFVYYVNTTVASAASGLTWNNLEFNVDSSTGSAVDADSVVVASAPSGCALAESVVGESTWISPISVTPCSSGTLGGGAAVVSGDTVSIETLSSLAGQGDSIVVDGESGYTGSVTSAIP